MGKIIMKKGSTIKKEQNISSHSDSEKFAFPITKLQETLSEYSINYNNLSKIIPPYPPSQGGRATSSPPVDLLSGVTWSSYSISVRIHLSGTDDIVRRHDLLSKLGSLKIFELSSEKSSKRNMISRISRKKPSKSNVCSRPSKSLSIL
jgi:hypothetical protein